MGAKVPSPCIDVCKFKRAGHCIGCAMTKPQKKTFKSLDGKKERSAFVEDLYKQQQRLGKYSHWLKAYGRKCEKKGVDCPVG
ncbi:MAG: DUF1289 domain-containing protein [Pseudomonadota bacterium]